MIVVCYLILFRGQYADADEFTLASRNFRLSQQIFTCSKSTIEIVENSVKYVQS